MILFDVGQLKENTTRVPQALDNHGAHLHDVLERPDVHHLRNWKLSA